MDKKIQISSKDLMQFFNRKEYQKVGALRMNEKENKMLKKIQAFLANVKIKQISIVYNNENNNTEIYGLGENNKMYSWEFEHWLPLFNIEL